MCFHPQSQVTGLLVVVGCGPACMAVKEQTNLPPGLLYEANNPELKFYYKLRYFKFVLLPTAKLLSSVTTVTDVCPQ